MSVRIDEETDELIKKLMSELSLSRSEVIRNALLAGLAEGKTVSRHLKNPVIRTIVRGLLAIEGNPEQLKIFEESIQASPPSKAVTA